MVDISPCYNTKLEKATLHTTCIPWVGDSKDWAWRRRDDAPSSKLTAVPVRPLSSGCVTSPLMTTCLPSSCVSCFRHFYRPCIVIFFNTCSKYGCPTFYLVVMSHELSLHWGKNELVEKFTTRHGEVIIQVWGVTSRPFFKCDVTASALHNDVCSLLVSLVLRLSTSVESRLFSCLTWVLEVLILEMKEQRRSQKCCRSAQRCHESILSLGGNQIGEESARSLLECCRSCQDFSFFHFSPFYF